MMSNLNSASFLRVRQVLRTTHNWRRRYRRLGRIIDTCGTESKRQLQQLRWTVIDIIERYHLPSVLQLLKEKINDDAEQAERSEEWFGDAIDDAVYDTLQMLSLWMRASGSVVLQEVTDDYEGVQTDDDDEQQRAYMKPHALYEPRKADDKADRSAVGQHRGTPARDDEERAWTSKRPRLVTADKEDRRRPSKCNVSSRVQEILRTTKHWLKRYHRLGRIIQSCDAEPLYDLRSLRNVVVDIIERHHLPSVVEQLQDQLLRDADDDAYGVQRPDMHDALQLFLLWMRGSGSRVQQLLFMDGHACEGSDEDDEGTDRYDWQGHGLYEQRAA